MDLGTDTTLFDFEPEDIGAQIAVEDLRLLLKASFGGDRSAAGRYAAEQRWKNHQKKEDDAKGRKGGGSLDDEIRRVSDVLTAVGNLPVKPDGDRVVELSDYENSRGSQFVDVVVKGKTFTVVSQAVIDAEKEVNALGKKVVTEIGERLVAEGKITQKELDDAISFQDSDAEKPTSAVQDLVAKAMRGDDDVPDEVREAAIEVSEAKAQAKEAKSALIKATKAYKKARDETEFFRLSPAAREAFEARREAKNENILARARLADQEYILEARAARALGDTGKTLGEAESETAGLVANSVRVQGLFGAEVQALLSSRREMGETFPSREVRVPETLTILDKDNTQVNPNLRAATILSDVARRFPAALLVRTESLNNGQPAVDFTSRAGGSYNVRSNTIRADLDNADTLTHETVHNISYFSAETRLIEQAALQRRVFGKVDDGDLPFGQKLAKGMQKMVGATKALGYRINGRYVEDKFVDGYQGRMDYNTQPSGMNLVGSTEALTVSVETVFGGSQKFTRSGKLDRDLLHTAVGWLLTAEGGA